MGATFLVGPEEKDPGRVKLWIHQLGIRFDRISIRQTCPKEGSVVIVGKRKGWAPLWSALQILHLNGRFFHLPHPDPRNKFWQDGKRKDRALRKLRRFMKEAG